MIDNRLNEQFDACRAGSEEADGGDLRQPELARLAEHLAAHPEDRHRLLRVQQFDRAVRAALDKVEPPADFADRVLARMHAAAAAQTLVEQAVAASDAIVDTPKVARPIAPEERNAEGTDRDSRRRKRAISPFWVGIGLAGVASLALAIYYAPEGSYTRDDILEAATVFCLDVDGQAGQLLTEKVPRGFPFSPAVKRNPRIEWVTARDCLGTKGVVFRLTPGGRKQAYLLALPARGLQIKGTRLPGTPGFRPLTTRGVTTDCWQERGLVYVLVVQGEEAEFRSFLQAQQPII